MFGLGGMELFIILAIVLVVFGGKKLRSLGGDLGGAISEFKTSLEPGEEEEEEVAKAAAPKTSDAVKEEVAEEKEVINK